VEALVVEPGDVFDDRKLELRAGAPDALADQLSLERVDETLGERIVVRVADRADRGEHAVVVERLTVVERGVLAAGVAVMQSAPGPR
jgi:hypothetical protein